MIKIPNNQIDFNRKKPTKEYLILELRMSLNKELLEKEIITLATFKKMQKILIKKMNDLSL